MYQIKFDFSDCAMLEDCITETIEQMPYVESTLLNNAAFKTRQVWIDATWPQHVEQRNAGFMNVRRRIAGRRQRRS